ncbi:endonuclease V [bacterium]|nr:endonuclease V [bacterium]
MNLKKAAQTQQRLSSRIKLQWNKKKLNRIGGADFSYDPDHNYVCACIVVNQLPQFEIIEIQTAVKKVPIPYIPGFLAFREGPAFLQAFRKIINKPDVTLVDGNGIAHPRKMGLAAFVGVILDISTIGCAKSPFFPFISPGKQRGSHTSILKSDNEKVGICLRTCSGVKPIFVSPGHKIDFLHSREFVLKCSRFRVPHPLREAHRFSRKSFE